MSQNTHGTPVVLAIDIGATKMAVGVVDSEGGVLFQAREPSPRSVINSLALIDELSGRMLQKAHAHGARVDGVGIACGGPLDLDRGLVLTPPNLPDWDAVPIRDRLAAAAGVPAYLQNDAAAGAIATFLWDNPGHVKDVTYITVSSGVGCGVITNGTLLTGHSGNGGELGHMPLVFDGRRCKCGLSGCVEAYVSGTSIGERFSEENGGPPATAQQIAASAAAGDPVALAHWTGSMRMLRRTVRAAVDVFDPALLCLGGGVTDARSDLLAPAFTFDEGGMSAAVGRGLCVRRTLFGRDSGVLSAAAVAWNEMGAANGRRVALREKE